VYLGLEWYYFLVPPNLFLSWQLDHKMVCLLFLITFQSLMRSLWSQGGSIVQTVIPEANLVFCIRMNECLRYDQYQLTLL
jgi:hypothetical protein